jgi:dipeptidyl aminopeptidase/acylaminoacyl peptidase
MENGKSAAAASCLLGLGSGILPAGRAKSFDGPHRNESDTRTRLHSATTVILLTCWGGMLCASPLPHAAQLTTEVAVEKQRLWEQHRTGSHTVSLQWIPRTHRMVFVREDESTTEIVLLDADSGMTRDIAAGLTPAISPDGRQVAFLRHGDSGQRWADANLKEEIWAANVDGTGLRRVVALAEPQRWWGCTVISWSPDSRQLLYSACPVETDAIGTTQRASKINVRVYPEEHVDGAKNELHVVNLEARTDRIVLRHRGDLGKSGWSDNESIWYAIDNGKRPNELWSRIEALNLRTLVQSTLVENLQHQVFYEPVLNPTTSEMALLVDSEVQSSAYYPVRSDLAVWDARDGSVRNVAYDIGLDWSFSWDPNGKRLLYSKGSSTNTQLYAVDMSGSQTRLTTTEGINTEATMSSDGDLLAWRYESVSGSSEVRLAKWSGGAIQHSRRLVSLDAAAAPKAEWRAVRWISEDQVEVDGIVSLPRGFDSKKSYPTVVILHGGPQSRLDRFAGEWPAGPYFLQILAERGYVAFLPDYRLSGAFGFEKMKQTTRGGTELLRGDFEDVMLGIDLLVKEGIANPRQLVLLGHSWGSTEAHWILTHTRRFAAAVSYEGSDLLLGWGSWRGPDRSIEWYVGRSPVTDWDLWVRNAAIAHPKGVGTPTMFVSCGKGISSASMEWMYSAWRAQDVPTELVIYPDEPHVVSSSAARRDLLNRILEWIDRYASAETHIAR